MILLYELIKRNWLNVLLLSLICVCVIRITYDKSKISLLQAQSSACSAVVSLQNQAVLQQEKLAKEEELKAKKAEKLAHDYHDREMDKLINRNVIVPRDCEGAMAFLVDDAKS